ncbi:hypothetical protein pb186bvf_015431 [Paramecium bursaria]
MARNCFKENHYDRMLCMNRKCCDYEQVWACVQCFENNYNGEEPRHLQDNQTDTIKSHFRMAQELQSYFEWLTQINQNMILNIELIDNQIEQQIIYIRNMLDVLEENKSKTVDNLKQQLYQQILYIQNLSYDDITRNNIEELEKIQQRSKCNYENYIYHNLQITVSQLADILELQQRKLRGYISQIDNQKSNQLTQLYSQLQERKVKLDKKSTLIEVMTMSMSYDEKYLITGGDSKILNLFSIHSLSKIQLNQEEFKREIRIVDFLREHAYPYQVAVLSDCISIYEIDLQKQTNQLKEIVKIQLKDCEDIKDIKFINKLYLIIIGKIKTYIYKICNQVKIGNEKLKITDIDVCQIQNRILIGHKNGFFYFGEFETQEKMISATIFSQAYNNVEKQQPNNIQKSLPITQVKIQRNKQRFLTCHADKFNDKLKINQVSNNIKIWNFQFDVIYQIQTDFLHANFIGQKQLFIIFTKEDYQIFNYSVEHIQNPQASRIICDRQTEVRVQCQSIIRDDQQIVSIITIKDEQGKQLFFSRMQMSFPIFLRSLKIFLQKPNNDFRLFFFLILYFLHKHFGLFSQITKEIASEGITIFQYTQQLDTFQKCTQIKIQYSS